MRIKSFTAYIAVSSRGYPAFFLGYATTAKQLRDEYAKRFPADDDLHGKSAFRHAGYKSVKVRIAESEK